MPISIHPDTKYGVDAGYQSIAKIHANMEIPRKRRKKNSLPKEDKRQNRDISSKRAAFENIIR